LLKKRKVPEHSEGVADQSDLAKRSKRTVVASGATETETSENEPSSKKVKRKRVAASEQQIAELHQQIEATSPDNLQELLQLLKRLKDFAVTISILMNTGIGKSVKKLCKHQDEKVAALAKTVLELYKKVMVKEAASGKWQEPPPSVPSPVPQLSAQQTPHQVQSDHNEKEPPSGNNSEVLSNNAIQSSADELQPKVNQ